MQECYLTPATKKAIEAALSNGQRVIVRECNGEIIVDEWRPKIIWRQKKWTVDAERKP